jgi:molybdopterin synthase sulfur carrier subunit
VVLVRYFAAARAAAGVTEEKVAADSLAALVEAVVSLHGERLARVLTACSFLVDGVSRRDPTVPLEPGATVDVLPPFAGG